MKKATHTNTAQLGFNFDAVLAAPTQTKEALLLPVMAHIADRLHTKLDMMRERGTLASTVSLTIKDDDKVMVQEALESDTDSLSTAQLTAFQQVAGEVLGCNEKVYLSYDLVDTLFNNVTTLH